jgi:hypothetical protein
MINGQAITYSYDQAGDVLEIVFQKGGGVGTDLTEHIVLRYNLERQEALSLILTSFSQLTRPTPFGPPSFHLAALSELPPEMQQTILHLLNTPPVHHFLKLSSLRLSPGGEVQPITSLAQLAELTRPEVLA